MKLIWISFAVIQAVVAYSQNVNIPDVNFKAYCVNNFDGIDGTTPDGEISFDEAALVTTISCPNQNISDVTGVEAFVNLESMGIMINQITVIPQLAMPNLKYLHFHSNQMTQVPDLSQLPSLISLNYSYNPIATAPDLSVVDLETLDCSNTPAGLPDISTQGSLYTLTCRQLHLTEFPDFSGNPNLAAIFAEINDISHLPQAQFLPPGLQMINMMYNRLTELPDLSLFPDLYFLGIDSNGFVDIKDVLAAPGLTQFSVKNNFLDEGDCTDIQALQGAGVSVTYDPQGQYELRKDCWPGLNVQILIREFNNGLIPYALVCP